MVYLEMALDVRNQFVSFLETAIRSKKLTAIQLKEAYEMTGKIATIYGHAFLEQYDSAHLATIFSINELIASLTYSSFPLDEEEVELYDNTLSHFEEVASQLKELNDYEGYSEYPFEEDILDINEIKEECRNYLLEENITAYNNSLRKLITFGEQMYRYALIEEEYQDGDDDENAYALFETKKEADEDLEYYYNCYNELLIDGDYNKEMLLNMIDNIE
ncbi:hypothetical protein SAMN05216520_102112 [Kandleria vitulina]|jgi:hypothetical protein|uniref:hypothetical protein n=1 Tax=Kandleria vitulina TaxID=1630 RepID=UPI000886CA8E|nr:hypothetical protein [Kandleria vitulina]SDL22239.1 hypothetical protein SAMN05216520_102112 [Kandleria vitulina]